jgi:hypothetical protein
MDVINATDRDFNIIYYLVQLNIRKLNSNQETQLIQIDTNPLVNKTAKTSELFV